MTTQACVVCGAFTAQGAYWRFNRYEIRRGPGHALVTSLITEPLCGFDFVWAERITKGPLRSAFMRSTLQRRLAAFDFRYPDTHALSPLLEP